MEVYVKHLRTRIISTGVFSSTTARYWAEREYAQKLMSAADDVTTVLLLGYGPLVMELIYAEMDRVWENSWFLPECEKIRCEIIDTIVGELSRMGIKITGKTRDGVTIESISTEKMDEITATVRRLFPGIVPASRRFSSD